MQTIPERIRELRLSIKLTQKEFAESLELSRGYIAQIECSKDFDVQDRIITSICNKFGVQENWLRYGQGPMYLQTDAALQKLFASYFLDITKAFSPVYSAYGEMMPIFSNVDIVRMYNYLAYRVKRAGINSKNINAIKQMFDVSFPGYEDIIIDLERKAFLTVKGMESSHVAQETRMPVSGLAAAGAPLYEESDGSESVSVPQQYCNDRFFVVQAEGDSMEPDIMDGDYVVVQRSLRPENGEIALVRVDGKAIEEYTIKCFFDHASKVELRSRNKLYQPMFYPIKHVISAEKVVHIIRK